MKTKFQAAVALQIRLPLELRQKLEEVKEETGKSVNLLVSEAIEKYLEPVGFRSDREVS